MFANPWIESIAKMYRLIIRCGSSLESLFLFLLRLTWGHQFVVIGLAKCLNIQLVANFFATVHIPFPYLSACLVAGLELICGLCLVVGFASRLVAIPLTAILLAAYGVAHAHPFHDFAFIKDPSLLVKEAPFPFLITTLTILIFGPGRLSLDAWLKRLSKGFRQY